MFQNPFEIMARRGVPPEDAMALLGAVRTARALAEAGWGAFVPSSDLHANGGTFIELMGVFSPLAKAGLRLPDGRFLRFGEVRDLPIKDCEIGFMTAAQEMGVPDLPEPTEEDAARLRDLLRGPNHMRWENLRVLAPTHDPAEAMAWAEVLVDKAGVVRELGGFRKEEGQVPQDLDIDNLGGNCPVQAEGTVSGHPFYYRARGSRQSFSTDDGFAWTEPVIGGRYDAGWIAPADAREFIRRASLAYARWAAMKAAT